MRIDANNPPIKFVLLPFPFSVSLFTSQLTGTNSHRARPNVCLFYLAIDIRVHGRRCSRAHCGKSSPRKFPRGKLASERWKWSVEKTVSRDIVGRSAGPLCHWRGGQVIVGERPRGISWFMSLLSFILKKFLSFLSKQKSFPLSFSLLLNSNWRSKSFPKEEKTCCCCCSLFTNIEISLLRIRFPLSRDIYREKINRTARIFPFFFFFPPLQRLSGLRMSGRGTNRNWFVFLSSAATF